MQQMLLVTCKQIPSFLLLLDHRTILLGKAVSAFQEFQAYNLLWHVALGSIVFPL